MKRVRGAGKVAAKSYRGVLADRRMQKWELQKRRGGQRVQGAVWAYRQHVRRIDAGTEKMRCGVDTGRVIDKIRCRSAAGAR